MNQCLSAYGGLKIFSKEESKMIVYIKFFEGLDFDSSNEHDDVYLLQYQVLTKALKNLFSYMDNGGRLINYESVNCRPLHLLLDILLKYKRRKSSRKPNSGIENTPMSKNRLFCAGVRLLHLLLEHGADPNSINEHGKTALYRLSHHLKKYFRGRPRGPLLNAWQLKFEVMIELLLLYGAEIHQNNSEEDPFKIALENGDADSLYLYIQHGYMLDKSDVKIPAPSALLLGFPLFELLARAGIFDLEARDTFQSTALHRAVTCSGTTWPATWHLEEIKLLIELGASVNAIDRCGHSILAKATCAMESVPFEMSVYNELLQLLVFYGAQVFENSSAQEPLINVLIYGNWESASFLLEQCLNRGVTRSQLWNLHPLHHATKNNDTEVLEELLLTGLFDIEQKNDKGKSPLHAAVTSRKASSYVRILDKWGADVNNVNNSGRTSLHLLVGTCEAGQEVVKCIEYLLWKGADVNLKTGGTNKLPLEIAMRCRMPQTSESIAAQIALLNHQGHTIDPQNYSFIRSRHSLEDFFQRCKAELDSAQASLIRGSISYYDFLVAKDTCLARCMGIESVHKAFESSNLQKLFPIYGKRMSERFVEIQEKRSLADQAAIGLSRVLGYDREAFYHIYESIIFYLTHRDLINLRKLMNMDQ